MATASRGREIIVIPRVHPELSCATVLTLDYIEGTKISEVTAEAGFDLERVARNVIEAAFRQLFEDGLFHGDPHPGNILVLPGNRIALLDFGLVGRLSRAQQEALVTLIVAVALRDPDSVARVMYRIGVPDARSPIAEFREDIRYILDRYVGLKLDEIRTATLLRDMLDLAVRHRIRIPKEYAVLAKASITIEGIIRRLYPKLDVLELGLPYAKELLLARFNPSDASSAIMKSLLKLQGLAEDVPSQLTQILVDVEGGKFRVNVHSEDLEKVGAHVRADLLEVLGVDVDAELPALEVHQDLGELGRDVLGEPLQLKQGLHDGGGRVARVEPREEELLRVRQPQLEHVELRVQPPDDPLDRDRGLREDRVLLRDPDPVPDREVEHVAQQRSGPDLVELESDVAVEDVADVLAELGDGGARVGDADPVHDARDALRITQRHRDDERDERLLLRAREPPHEPEVEQGDPVSGEDEDVPRVRVPVEEPILEELPERRLDDVLRDLLEVEAPLGGDLGDLRPLDVVEREDRRAGELRVHARDHDDLAAPRGRRHLRHVPRLVREVELLVHRPVELLDDAGRGVDARLLDDRLEQGREVVEEREVRLDPLADPRPLHLHDHPLARVRVVVK